MFKGNVFVTLREGVLDPQGGMVKNSLNNLGFNEVKEVKAGKFFEVWLDTTNKEEAVKQLEVISEKLLANLVVEDYRVEVVEVEG